MNKRFQLFIIGAVLLITGMTLILKNWSEVIIFFKGLIGLVLALTGMIILFFMKDARLDSKDK